MDYLSVLGYLYDLTDYEKERIARYDPDTLDLSRIRRVLARLGDPQQRFPSVHIAGTKGKGSVAATCASVLQAAGLRTGLYTSPHLHTFRERIRVDGQLISPDVLISLVQQRRPIFDTEPELTTFEAITALAFAHFAQCQVDYAVLEVGLGGRLDATNVVTPQVSIITSLSFDHTYLLGDTLADIAREKAGIIKPGVPTVCAPQRAEALEVIRQICTERESPLTLVGRDWTWQLHAPSPAPSGTNEAPAGLEGQSFALRCTGEASPLQGTYTTPLLGRHQVNNAVAAIAALDLLRRGGTALQPHHIHLGLAAVRWPGRFEILRKDPPLVVDCAHNADSAAKLAVALDEWFPGQTWTLILGASSDKDVTGMLRALAPRANCLLATQARHPRAMPAQKVADLAFEVFSDLEAPVPEIKVTDNVGAALSLALTGEDHASVPGEQAAPVCVTGSIFVVADARELWALHEGYASLEADDPIDQALLPLGQRRAAQAQTATCTATRPATVHCAHELGRVSQR